MSENSPGFVCQHRPSQLYRYIFDDFDDEKHAKRIACKSVSKLKNDSNFKQWLREIHHIESDENDVDLDIDDDDNDDDDGHDVKDIDEDIEDKTDSMLEDKEELEPVFNKKRKKSIIEEDIDEDIEDKTDNMLEDKEELEPVFNKKRKKSIIEEDKKKKKKTKHNDLFSIKNRNGFCQWLINKWKTENEQKAAFGTVVHKLIAAKLDGVVLDEQALLANFSADDRKSAIDRVQCAIQYHNKLHSRGFFLQSVETTVGCEELSLCGTVDAIYFNEELNHCLVVDWKTTAEVQFTPKAKFDCCKSKSFYALPNCNTSHWMIQLNCYELLLKSFFKTLGKSPHVSSVAVVLNGLNSLRIVKTKPQHSQILELLNKINDGSITKPSRMNVDLNIKIEEIECEEAIIDQTTVASTKPFGEVVKQMSKYDDQNCTRNCTKLLKSFHSKQHHVSDQVYHVENERQVVQITDFDPDVGGIFFVLQDPTYVGSETMALLRMHAAILRHIGYSGVIAYMDVSPFNFNNAQRGKPTVFDKDVVQAISHLFFAHRLKNDAFSSILKQFQHVVLCGKVASTVVLKNTPNLKFMINHSISLNESELTSVFGAGVNVMRTDHPSLHLRHSQTLLQLAEKRIRVANMLFKTLQMENDGLLLIGDIVRLLPHRVKFRHHHWQPISLQRARCLIAGKVQPRARISTRWRLLPALFALNDNTPYVNQIVDAQLGIDRHFFVADTPDGYDSLVARGVGFSYARSSYLAAKRRWGGFKHNLLLRPVLESCEKEAMRQQAMANNDADDTPSPVIVIDDNGAASCGGVIEPRRLNADAAVFVPLASHTSLESQHDGATPPPPPPLESHDDGAIPPHPPPPPPPRHSARRPRRPNRRRLQEICDLFIIHGCYDFLDSHNRESLKRIKGYRMGIRTFIKFVKKMMRVYDYKRNKSKSKNQSTPPPPPTTTSQTLTNHTDNTNTSPSSSSNNEGNINCSSSSSCVPVRRFKKERETNTSNTPITTQKRNDFSPFIHQEYKAQFIPLANQPSLPPSTEKKPFPIERNSTRGQLKKRDNRSAQCQAVLVRHALNGIPRLVPYLSAPQRVWRRYYIKHGFKAFCERYGDTRHPYAFVTALLYVQSEKDSYPALNVPSPSTTTTITVTIPEIPSTIS